MLRPDDGPASHGGHAARATLARGTGGPSSDGWRAAARRFAVVVLLPFAVTRAALLVVAWFGEQFAPSWTYFDAPGATRGWSRVPSLWLDVWGRYDTWWYLDLAEHGYRAPADLTTTQSNLAFFPLYPALVRAGHALLPAAWRGETARYAVAVAVANLCAIAALWVVDALVREVWRDAALARRAVLYLILFPAGFFLSCAYSESTYLLAVALTFLLAARGRWWLAGACGLALGVSRATGVLAAPALAVLYLSQRGWSARRVRWDALTVLAAPAALAAHAVRLAVASGDPLALFHAQGPWHRTLAAPWIALTTPSHPKMGPVDLAATLLLVVLALALLRERRWAFATLALVSLAPIICSGTLMSATRFVAAVFPAFVPLARAGRREAVDRTVLIAFAFGQALLFLAWSRFYWVA